MPLRLVQSLYASAMWRLQQRSHLSIANVVIHRFAASRGRPSPAVAAENKKSMGALGYSAAFFLP
jgi:hypothetical protein